MNSQQQGGIVARLRRLFGSRDVAADRQEAAKIYSRAVVRARQPELYMRYKVADTPAGRYEMIAWQVMVELNLLGDRGEDGRRIGQEVVDLMFTDMDRSLRELGVGDPSVGRQMRELGNTWKARVALAQRALPPPATQSDSQGDQQELAVFLERNAGAREAPADGQGLAADLLQILQRLRAEQQGGAP